MSKRHQWKADGKKTRKGQQRKSRHTTKQGLSGRNWKKYKT